MGFHHVALATSDLQRTHRFYTEAMGFELAKVVVGGTPEGGWAKHAFYEAGGRMIDTADVYSAWIPGHKGGESETVLGQWFEKSGVRNEMRIHTKTGMLGGAELYEPARVLQSLDASLERLRTDRIDLYYAHKDYPELDIAQVDADGEQAPAVVPALPRRKELPGAQATE